MSQLVAELPWNITSSAIFFLCWYWTIGYPTGRAGYSFLALSIAFLFYYTTLGHAVLRAELVEMDVQGLLGQVLLAVGSQTIICSSTELVSVNLPMGMTCSEYMDPFLKFAGGYLTNPGAVEGCQYCPYKTTDEYMYLRFNIKYSDHWRNLGIVFGFAVFNIIAIFWLTYSMRIRSVSVFTSLKQRLARGKFTKYTEVIWIDLRDTPSDPIALIENSMHYRINFVAILWQAPLLIHLHTMLTVSSSGHVTEWLMQALLMSRIV
ncbi:uncharacterized protein F5891DRAFT_985375 [Suillus fuscotomentosus]|uniref:CDR ABC transporter domain-containing protein n=1 Tax=Suillus fuscotomentosus TaxID=1912939 RepID=A0AAD4HEY4_9AGAM|nr:uncharacterized protein F5891DRAFT_985375 [Suillus fuscotomentosus]KAG1894027.1 hypothetical protein F5891DRAFT_985375 [Suillus fuscotomentosus]